uniref:Secreted protein n=2 Tax=Triticum urartu TaxID=4572 RepID=A0A8R7UFF8_TRIUA
MEMVAISSILLHITSLATQIVAVARSGRGSRHRADTSAAQQQPDRRWVLELIQQLVIDQEASTSTATVRGSLLQAPSAWIGDMSICTNRRGPQVHMVRASLRTNSTYDNQQINCFRPDEYQADWVLQGMPIRTHFLQHTCSSNWAVSWEVMEGTIFSLVATHRLKGTVKMAPFGVRRSYSCSML